MKKIISLLLIITIMLCTISCSKKEVEEKPKETVGMANPVKEYASLDEINEVTKCHITLPLAYEVSDVKYSTINDEMAQVNFTYLNHTWTIRGSHDTENDISGIYDEHNYFEANQDGSVYLNDYLIDRMFTEGQQYTIVMDKPEINEEEMFSNVVFDIMKVIKNACDPNNIAGEYADSVSQRATMEITKYDDQYEIIVRWANDATSFKEWYMSGEFIDNKLVYEGEDISIYKADENGDTEIVDSTSANNLGVFELKDQKLYWTGAAEESCRSCVFEKVQ